MSAMASQITGVSSVCSTVCSGADQRKYQSCASLDIMRGIHQSPVDSPHKRLVTRKMFPFDDVIMKQQQKLLGWTFIETRISSKDNKNDISRKVTRIWQNIFLSIYHKDIEKPRWLINVNMKMNIEWLWYCVFMSDIQIKNGSLYCELAYGYCITSKGFEQKARYAFWDIKVASHERHGVWNRQQLDRLFSSLFRIRTMEI